MLDDTSSKSAFVAGIAAHQPALPGSGQDWLDDLRATARQAFLVHGVPTQRDEDWKYTNITALAEADPVFATTKPGDLDTPTPAKAVDAIRIVMVNGGLDPARSELDALPGKVSVRALDEAIGGLRDSLGQLVDVAARPMAALNTALVGDGLVVEVADGALIDRPLEILFVNQGTTTAELIQPRVLIRLGAGARATVLETHVGTGAYSANLVTEAFLGPDAQLRHYKRQDESTAARHVALLGLKLDKAAGYEGFVLHTGAAVARHEVIARIVAPHAEVNVNGAYLVTGARHVDNTTLVRHEAPDGRSRQVFKGVMDDNGRGVFQGKVYVDQVAQKTDAHQLSRALLLSRKAEMDGKPELEIYADDVKCSHGATVGELEADALFYLRSRGIDAETARRILVEAFIADVVSEIGHEATREHYGDLVRAFLDENLGASAGA